MQIKRIAYRQEQKSLLNEERSEVRVVLEIEHEGHTGFLRMDIWYEKRDADTEYFCDVPGITLDYIANTDWSWKLNEAIWNADPATTPGPSGAEIAAEIKRLGSHQLRS